MDLKINEFKEAVNGFEYLVTVDMEALKNVMDKRLIDGIENGMAQKFEYSIELCWKLIKNHLKKQDGIDAKSPKQSIKEFYLAGYIDEDHYLRLIDMIDDRNRLSHIYDKDEFNKILKRFPPYVKTFNRIIEILEKGQIQVPGQDLKDNTIDAINEQKPAPTQTGQTGTQKSLA